MDKSEYSTEKAFSLSLEKSTIVKTSPSDNNSSEETLKKMKKLSKQKSFYGSWWLLLIYMFLVINSGSIFWGWAGGFREMFLKMGAYSWQSEVDQNTSVGYLLTVASLSNLISDIVVGNVLDYFGPRYTLLIGVCIRFIGWILLAFASQPLQSFYLLGMIFIGVSTDFIYFPFCSVGSLYKKKRGLVVSLLGASMSFSSIIPILIYRIWEDLLTSWSASLYLPIYALGWLIMMSLAAVFLFPIQGFSKLIVPEPDELDKLTTVNSANNQTITWETSQTRKSVSYYSKIINWFRPVIKPSFLILIPIGCFLVLRSEYAQRNTYRDIPLTYDIWIIISPLRFIPCAVMGEISDRLGHLKTMFVFECIAAILFLANFFEGMFPDVVSTICIFIFTSWIMTSQYVYISKTQPSEEFGRFCGTISLISGAFLSLNIPIAPLTQDELGRNIVGGIMLALSFVNIGILISTFFFDYKINWINKK